MNTANPVKRLLWIAGAIALLIGFLLLLAGALSMAQFFRSPSSTRVYTTATLLQQVQTLNELVTVKYVMEKVVIVEDATWYGENRVMLVAHGVVKAGIDLNQLKSEHLRISGKKIEIQLPAPHVTDVYLDERKTQIIERSTGLLRQFDKDMEQNARRMAVADMRSAALGNGILTEASSRAKTQLTSLFHQLGFDSVEIKAP